MFALSYGWFSFVCGNWGNFMAFPRVLSLLLFLMLLAQHLAKNVPVDNCYGDIHGWDPHPPRHSMERLDEQKHRNYEQRAIHSEHFRGHAGRSPMARTTGEFR